MSKVTIDKEKKKNGILREVVEIVGIVVKGGGKDKKYEEKLKFQIGLERNL